MKLTWQQQPHHQTVGNSGPQSGENCSCSTPGKERGPKRTRKTCSKSRSPRLGGVHRGRFPTTRLSLPRFAGGPSIMVEPWIGGSDARIRLRQAWSIGSSLISPRAMPTSLWQLPCRHFQSICGRSWLSSFGAISRFPRLQKSPVCPSPRPPHATAMRWRNFAKPSLLFSLE